MATLMLENGADIRFIQQMLEHSKLSGTQIYTQVSIRMLKHVHAAPHPPQLQKPEPLANSQKRKPRRVSARRSCSQPWLLKPKKKSRSRRKMTV
jgi:hypothetical protein